MALSVSPFNPGNVILLEHFILHCPRWEEWRIESRSLQRPRIEETDQVLGEILFGGHEKENAAKDVE